MDYKETPSDNKMSLVKSINRLPTYIDISRYKLFIARTLYETWLCVSHQCISRREQLLLSSPYLS